METQKRDMKMDPALEQELARALALTSQRLSLSLGQAVLLAVELGLDETGFLDLAKRSYRLFSEEFREDVEAVSRTTPPGALDAAAPAPPRKSLLIPAETGIPGVCEATEEGIGEPEDLGIGGSR